MGTQTSEIFGLSFLIVLNYGLRGIGRKSASRCLPDHAFSGFDSELGERAGVCLDDLQAGTTTGAGRRGTAISQPYDEADGIESRRSQSVPVPCRVNADSPCLGRLANLNECQ